MRKLVRRHKYEYGSLLIGDRFETVFWVDASNKEALEQSYKSIALRINQKLDQKCSTSTALQQLEYLETEWLLLFDGADDIDAISGLWPPGLRGNVLYTSRNHMLRQLTNSQTQKVDEMTEDEAKTLLLKAARLDSVGAQGMDRVLPIVEELGLLPLAIDQAGAYIANGQCRVEDFLSIFKAHRQDLLQIDAYKGVSDYSQAVYATWELSYRAIDKLANKDLNNGARDALQILHIFAFFHYENIMEDIFNYTAENAGNSFKDSLSEGLVSVNVDGSWNNFRFRQGIRLLLSYSLISRDELSRSFSMHQLVHG